jgi:hypothetical protein
MWTQLGIPRRTSDTDRWTSILRTTIPTT